MLGQQIVNSIPDFWRRILTIRRSTPLSSLFISDFGVFILLDSSIIDRLSFGFLSGIDSSLKGLFEAGGLRL
ncbi:unnamed protein product [Cuscuta campestris]|uniref:Uncharacterized protein n=1 Tax=Cuscuta campestris TaxID=132261 RepID=A0A484NBG9_9ASTE|nr:unnamed protein product [Cuscuta campestris]